VPRVLTLWRVSLPDFLPALQPGERVAVILVVALLSHLLVRLVRRGARWFLAPPGTGPHAFLRRYPKAATLTTIVASALTFAIYFTAFGLLLRELGFSLTAYLASASVIGLAIGFGSQGLVQDVVIGLTLIFSDVLDVGDVADIGGQTGRIESIGLRFTTLVTLLDQRVHVPNRSITQINRYRKGHIRAYADIQVPDSMADEALVRSIEEIARGMHAQYRSIVLAPPELLGIRSADPGPWRYLRVKFRLWPAQGALVENVFRQRALAVLRLGDPAYPDWMISVTYRAQQEPRRAGGVPAGDP
jgi:moderate conductance mechanosensitive channel